MMGGRKTLEPGDAVSWRTPRGETHGKVTRKITGTARAGGHVAKASDAAPEYEVRSDKTGRAAIHKPSALRKRRSG